MKNASLSPREKSEGGEKWQASIGKRNRSLDRLLSEFRAEGKRATLDEADLLALSNAFELTLDLKSAMQLAIKYFEKHPEDERVLATILRCQYNLNEPEAIAELLLLYEHRFPAPSPIWFFHSTLSKQFLIQEKWASAYHHAVIAAERKLKVVDSQPMYACSAILDFKTMVVAAKKIGASSTASQKLEQFYEQLNRMREATIRLEPAIIDYSQLCIITCLRFDIAYWLADPKLIPALDDWIDAVESGAEANSKNRRLFVLAQASELVAYFKLHTRLLTREMIGSLTRFDKFLEGICQEFPNDIQLAALSRHSQYMLEGVQFGVPTPAPDIPRN